MTSDPAAKTETLVRHLREQDRHAEADRLAAAASGRQEGNAFLLGLREVCQTILTAIEAIELEAGAPGRAVDVIAGEGRVVASLTRQPLPGGGERVVCVLRCRLEILSGEGRRVGFVEANSAMGSDIHSFLDVGASVREGARVDVECRACEEACRELLITIA